MPTPHGEIGSKVGPGSKKLCIEQVLARCPDALTRARMELLVEEWVKLGNPVEPCPSGLSFRAQIGAQMRGIFWANTPKTVYVVFRRFENQGVPPEIIQDYRRELAELAGFDRQKVLTKSAPGARLVNLTEQDVRAFVRLNQHLAERWRQSTGS